MNDLIKSIQIAQRNAGEQAVMDNLRRLKAAEIDPALKEVSPGNYDWDLDKESWNQIKQAANESKWIPKEYYMNDWVSDVCRFLRDGADLK